MTLLKFTLLTFLLVTLGLTQVDAATTKVKPKAPAKPKISLDEKIKTCGEILKAKFPDYLPNEKLNIKLDAVMDNRVEIAFGRTALAYLKLQAERDKGRSGEADHVASKIRTMPEADKALADKLFALIEKDPPEQDVEKVKESLDALLKYSKRLNLKPHQIMDESDVTIMSGFLAGEADADSTEGYGKIFRELKEFALYKGGRENKNLTAALGKKLDSFQNTRNSFISKAQQAVIAEIKKMAELSNECKSIITNLLVTRKTDKLTKLDENCETFAFLSSAFPSPKIKGFAKMNGKVIDYLLDSGVDQIEPDPVFESIKRGEVKCRNYSKNGDTYKFDLLLNAPRKNFQGWSFRDPNGDLKSLGAPEQKFVVYKKKKVPAKEGNINFTIPSFQVPADKIGEKLKIISESGQEYELVDLVRACRLPVPVHGVVLNGSGTASNTVIPASTTGTPTANDDEEDDEEDATTGSPSVSATPTATPTVTQGLQLDPNGCAFSVDKYGKVVIDQINLTGATAGTTVKIGTKEVKVISKDGTLGLFDVKLGVPPLPDTMIFTTPTGKVNLSLKDCSSYTSIQQQIDDKKAEKEEEEKARTKEEKAAEIRNNCEGGEGKWVTKSGMRFVACRNGVSDGERNMIKQFCDGQGGEYDVQSDKIFCTPYNSSAPAPMTLPTLPASIFDGVGGVNMKGFY